MFICIYGAGKSCILQLPAAGPVIAFHDVQILENAFGILHSEKRIMRSATFEAPKFFFVHLLVFLVYPLGRFAHCMNIVVFLLSFKYTVFMEESDVIRQVAFDELTAALVRATDPVLVGDFLRCLLTPSELQEVSSRWALVREIDAGTTQREIARKMGLSLCKITRGSRELKKENSPFRQMIRIYQDTVSQ